MKKDWKFGQTEDQTSVREPEKEGAGEVRGWPVPVSLTERTSRTNSENTCWVQASLLYKAWVILGRDGKSFLKELSLIAKKKTGPKFSIFPFSAFPPTAPQCTRALEPLSGPQSAPKVALTPTVAYLQGVSQLPLKGSGAPMLTL